MAIQKGTIEAISHKYEKFAVLIEEKWYNTKAEYAAEWPVKPQVGDVIQFDDGGKKYLGRMKIISSTAPAVASAAPKSGGYSSLGVEVGHASNLAMRMMEQGDTHRGDIGSPEYYRQFAQYTQDVYKLMAGIKKKLGAAPEEAPAPKVEDKPEAAPEPVAAVEDDLSDLF